MLVCAVGKRGEDGTPAGIPQLHPLRPAVLSLHLCLGVSQAGLPLTLTSPTRSRGYSRGCPRGCHRATTTTIIDTPGRRGPSPPRPAQHDITRQPTTPHGARPAPRRACQTMALKPRVYRAAQSRYVPLLLLLPFLLGLLSTHWNGADRKGSPSGAASTGGSKPPSGFLPSLHLAQTSCLPHVLVDTPSSAGVNAVQTAVTRLVAGRAVTVCRAPEGCAGLLRGVCNGSVEAPGAVVGFLGVEAETVACLRARRGFYAAVAGREPLDRWSAEYVRMGKVVKYLEWMGRYPDCSLLDYFDGRGAVCADDDDVLARVEEVAARFDEGVDVFAGKGGELYERVKRLIGDAVRRDRPSKKFRAFLGMNRLIGETRLYEAVIAIRPREGRTFC